jgi:putative tryptophan/tyrosine transport system substrate-binding protein
MKRRQFIAGLGGAAVWPVVGRAQEFARPVVGWIALAPVELSRIQHDAVLRGLAETGFVAGRNLTFEYHSVDYRLDRMPAVAAELVHRRVSVLGAGSLAATLAAKDATQKIPTVFVMGANPVERGIVPSLARPGGNITGVTNLNNELIAKRLEILHELVPSATLVALLVNPTGPLTKFEVTLTQATAKAFGLRLQIVNAAVPGEIEEALADVAQSGAGALLISGDALFLTHRTQVIALTSRFRVPAIYAYREVTEAGGLLSYGTDLGDPYRIAGDYAGRILNGEKPGDLPVQQSTKVELLLNLKIAKALGIAFPLALLARADEVIDE